MRILLDEYVNAGFRAAFRGHAVKTVAEMGWRASKDMLLLTYAQDSFEVFVTIDRQLEHQHDLKKLRLGIVIARVPDNEIGSYQPIFSELLKAAEAVKTGEVNHVYSPLLRR